MGNVSGSTIGVDIGGTKILAGVVNTDGLITSTARCDTARQDAGKVLEQVANLVRELRTASPDPIIGVGAGIAGGVSKDRSFVYFAPNLVWERVPAGEILTAECEIPVVIENDGNAAAWGEVQFGAARGECDVVMITVGTGIGGGIVINGEMFRGAHGAASEIGHITMVPEGRPCGCGRVGCWEQYASGNALVREARALAGERRSEAGYLLGLGDGTPEGVQGAHITAAALAGDPVAIAAFDTVGTWLGQGLADLTAVLDPDVFVIGGGVSDAGELLLASARATLAEQLVGGNTRPTPRIVLAQLGNSAGLIGAADLARH